MNIIQFKYAIEVERTGSISQAAENLYMAQPNLSKAIRELEETLGFPVFERTSRGVVPTRRGEEFLKLARGVLLQVEQMEALRDDEPGNVQRLSLSMPRGSYIADGVALGHRRLSLIDLKGGNQPMVRATADPGAAVTSPAAEGSKPGAYSTGDYAIVFNGEIYNYRDLRAERAAEGKERP